MTYSSDRRPPKSSSIQSPAQRAGAGAASFLDKRASTAAQMQLKQKIDGSLDASAAGSIAQLMTEEEETLQGKFDEDEEPLQAKSDDEEEPLQAKFAGAAPAQLAASAEARPNNTGLPDNLKSGIENLSGMSMDHVKVHYNSAQPAQLNAHAYAQGSEIHVAPGQEQHLPHEAWHVVQQAQGRVKPTMQMKAGVPVNDDAGLEAEADVMGARALAVVQSMEKGPVNVEISDVQSSSQQMVQREPIIQLLKLPIARHREIVVDAAKRMEDPAKRKDNDWILAIYQELDGEGHPGADKCVARLIEQNIIDQLDWDLIESDFKLYKAQAGQGFDRFERHQVPKIYNEDVANKWVASLIQDRILDLYTTVAGFVGHAIQIQLKITTLVHAYQDGKIGETAYGKYKKEIIQELQNGKKNSPLAIPEYFYTFEDSSSVKV